MIGSFSGWGAEQLILRRVGRAREELPRAMATSLVFLALSAPPSAAVTGPRPPGHRRIHRLANRPLRRDLRHWAGPGELDRRRLLSGSGPDRRQCSAERRIRACPAAGRPSLDPGRPTPRRPVLVELLPLGLAIAAPLLWRMRRDLGSPEWKIAWHEWRDGFSSRCRVVLRRLRSTDKPVIALLSICRPPASMRPPAASPWRPPFRYTRCFMPPM